MRIERLHRLREHLGWFCLYAVQLFPLSLPVFLLIPPAVVLGDRLGRRAPRIERVLRAGYFALCLGATLLFARMTSFLGPLDWATSTTAAAAGYAIARLRPAYRSLLLGLPLAFGLPLAILPPIIPGLVARAEILGVAAVLFLILLVLVGPSAARRPGPYSWAWAVFVPSVLVRTFLFYVLPAAAADEIVAAVPGARIFFRAEPTPRFVRTHGPLINSHDLRFAVQGCEEGSRIVGILSSFCVGSDIDPARWKRVDLVPGDAIALDCRERIAYVADYTTLELVVVSLDTLEIRRPFHKCKVGKPTIVLWNEERTALYGYDWGGSLSRFDPETHECRIVVEGANIMGYSVDESLGEALIARNGRLDLCSISSGRCETKVLLADPDLPAWLQTDTLANPFFGMHLHKIARDPTRGAVFVTSGRSGILYRVDRETMRLTGTVLLEPGIRWVATDPERGRVFVGGFVRGHLYVVDADTMQVLGKAFIGKRIRFMQVDARGRLLVATSAGALEIDVEGLLAAGKTAPRGTR